MSLVELGRYSNAHVAEIARGRLESEGLHAVVFDGNYTASEAFGGFAPARLMVLAEDLDEARAVLGHNP